MYYLEIVEKPLLIDRGITYLKGVSLAELGRQALKSYLVEARRQLRLQRLCETATRHADIIEGVAEEWQITEVEGWPDD